ncbi:MAG: GTP-binding protein [Heyndrickxia sp.]
MNIINIGIVAHVDAGKTSLTERILFETNVIEEIGKVDQGNTQTDTLELERRRGITIKASVVSFMLKDTKVNLIDTPGHADFIAEVERSFSVLDGAILVISAVEGIQAQTKILMSILKKLGIPTFLFINKVDRKGAQSASLFEKIKGRLAENIIPLYTVENIGTKKAQIVAKSFEEKDFLEEMIEIVAMNDDTILEAYVNGGKISESMVFSALRKQISEAKLYPVFFGSAMTGIGVQELLEGVTTMFPANHGMSDASLTGVIFKIEREPSGEKIAYVRLFSGSMNVRDYVNINRKKLDGEIEKYSDKIIKLQIFKEGICIQTQKVASGDFCKVWGLRNIRIGDVVGEWSASIVDIHFASPQLETRIEAIQKEKSHQLYQALQYLAEEDPLIQVLKDDFHHELYIRLFGEVQKEVVETTLKEQYHLEVSFSETRIVCMEKPKGIGFASEIMGDPGNPFYGTVGFRIEPGNTGSGVTYRLEVELGSLPLSFHKAIEDTVYEVLQQGLYGWEVTDIIITLTHSGYASPVTTAADFRNLGPLVLMEELKNADTNVYEPMNEFELTVPVGSISKAMFKLSALQADFEEPIVGKDLFFLKGSLPMAVTENFKRGLHSFTEGEGILITNPSGYKKMASDFPTRKRVDYNPLNRKEYLMHVMRTI